MMKKLQKHSINIFVTLLKAYRYQKILPLKEPSVELLTDPLKLALEEYKNHPSLKSIKNKMTSMDNPKFSFRLVSLNKTLDVS